MIANARVTCYKCGKSGQGDPLPDMADHFEHCPGPILSGNTIAGDLLMLRTWHVEQDVVIFRGPYLA